MRHWPSSTRIWRLSEFRWKRGRFASSGSSARCSWGRRVFLRCGITSMPTTRLHLQPTTPSIMDGDAICPDPIQTLVMVQVDHLVLAVECLVGYRIAAGRDFSGGLLRSFSRSMCFSSQGPRLHRIGSSMRQGDLPLRSAFQSHSRDTVLRPRSNVPRSQGAANWMADDRGRIVCDSAFSTARRALAVHAERRVSSATGGKRCEAGGASR
jgi:hypothetical protein